MCATAQPSILTKQTIRRVKSVIIYICKGIIYSGLIAVPTGYLVALFLWLLDVVTRLHFEHNWLLYLLPISGVAIQFAYDRWGKDIVGGNADIIEEIHRPQKGIPGHMAPMILITTLVTHLFGGSAGREGTAVQVGGSVAGFFQKLVLLPQGDLPMMLIAGMSAGFGAVFGTPFSGIAFAFEVIGFGAAYLAALFPAIMSAFLANEVCKRTGIKHTHFPIAPGNSIQKGFPFIVLDSLLAFKAAVAGVGFGLAGRGFAAALHEVKRLTNKYFAQKWLVPVFGGCLVILLTLVLGSNDYNGIGVYASSKGGVSIVTAFQPGGSHFWSWLWKAIMTILTLGTGFKGGEVTPLFFIGATLGNTLSSVLQAPTAVFAAVGFLAVFAAATNTPLASTIMGVELFGIDYVLYFAIGCSVAYVFSGYKGIYLTKDIRVHSFKADNLLRRKRR